MKLSVFLGIITTLIAESTGKGKLTQCSLRVFQFCEKGAAKNSLNSENQHISAVFLSLYSLYVTHYADSTQRMKRTFGDDMNLYV